MIPMWKAIKWHGKYYNLYIGKDLEEDTIKIMYPPKDKEFIKRHRALMKSKGYEVISISSNITYTYKKMEMNY